MVCNGDVIHTITPLNECSILKPKKIQNPKVQKSNLAHFGLKSSKPAIVNHSKII